MSDSPPDNSQASALPHNPEELAKSRAEAITEAIANEPGEYGKHLQLLEDLKLAIIRDRAETFYEGKYESIRPDSEFLWNLAQDLPDFNVDALYQKRATLVSLAVAIFLGWILGGLLATIFGFLGLGGEILRPLAIFCLLWLGEYLSANPRARNIALAILGLGGLARFATAVVGGFIRFTTFGAWRQAIFGGGVLPNIFKTGWLFFGSFFVFIFLSKKITGLDLTAFKHSIGKQIGQDLKLADFVFAQIDERDIALARCQGELDKSNSSSPCAKAYYALAQAVLSLLDTFDEPTRHYLAEKLERAGYSAQGEQSGDLIWNSEVHEPLYETVGLINDGDPFKILRRAYRMGDKLVKGHAQRLG